MALVHVPDAADALHRRLVADMAAERVARVRRIGDDAPVADDVHRRADEPRLRVLRMNRKVLRHSFVCAGCHRRERHWAAVNAPTWTKRASKTPAAAAAAPARRGFPPARGNRHRAKRGTPAPAPRVATSRTARDDGCR